MVYPSASSGCLLGTPSFTRTHTRRWHAEHAAPRQACRASLNFLHVFPVFLVPLSHGDPPALLDPCTSSRNNKHTSSTRGDDECLRLGVMLGGYAPSDLVPFLSLVVYISHKSEVYMAQYVSKLQTACLWLVRRMYRGEFDQGQARRSGALFSEEVRPLPSDETRKAFTRKRARENTVRSWYQNVQRLMSCTVAEPPAFKGKTITERAGRRSSMQVSPPTQTLVVHPGIASRSSSFRPILGRRQYDYTCHTKRQGSAPAKRLCLQYFAILLLSTLGRTPRGSAAQKR